MYLAIPPPGRCKEESQRARETARGCLGPSRRGFAGDFCYHGTTSLRGTDYTRRGCLKATQRCYEERAGRTIRGWMMTREMAIPTGSFLLGDTSPIASRTARQNIGGMAAVVRIRVHFFYVCCIETQWATIGPAARHQRFIFFIHCHTTGLWRSH